ncbi:MAG: polysaccharide biosynthesis C-terminal domain-containing protein, partial [Patescibacteria group bacterium]
VGALSFFAMTVSQMLMGVFQKHMAMWRPALAETVSRAIILFLILALAKTQATVPHMMWAFTAGNVMMLLLNFLSANKYAKVRLSVDKELLRVFVGRSWPLALSILFNLLYLKGDVIFMSLLDRSDAEIGHYGAAYKVLDVISVIPTMFMGLLLPLLTKAWAEKNRAVFHSHLQRAFDLFSLLAFPILAGAIVLSVPIMTLVAGSDFAPSGTYLIILMLANTAVFFGILFSHAIVALNKQKIILPAFLFTAIIAIILYMITIPRFGATGAAWSTVASEVIIGAIAMIVVLRVSGFRPRFRNAFASLISASLMGTALFFIHSAFNDEGLTIIFEIIFGAVIFFIFAFAFGSIKKETIRTILKPQTI